MINTIVVTWKSDVSENSENQGSLDVLAQGGPNTDFPGRETIRVRVESFFRQN